MAGVVLAGVSRVYSGGVAAVDNIDLEVADGELVALVGPSGCGKSTMLRLIAGLEQPTHGTIRIAGQAVDQLPPRARDVAMVFQNEALYPHLSVYENLAFGLKLRGGGRLRRAWRRIAGASEVDRSSVDGSSIDRRVRRAAASLGLESLLERTPGQLSGGERQRVALGRAIVRHPRVFLFDEPLSNLDARLQDDLRRELKRLHGRLAATMIYVTHDQLEALSLGDRVVVLDRGRVQQVGTPAEIYDRPRNRFVAGFIGTPPMNLCEGRLARAERGLRFVAAGWSLPVDALRGERLTACVERPVVLGVRPEDVRIETGDSESGVPARIAMVESTGDSVVAHLALGDAAERDWQEGGTIACKADARTGRQATTGWGPGQRVTAQFDLERTHWFDAGSGENLEWPGPPGGERPVVEDRS